MLTIQAQVVDNRTDEVMMDRTFTEENWLHTDKPLTVDAVMVALESYILGEALQAISEIKLRAKVV